MQNTRLKSIIELVVVIGCIIIAFCIVVKALPKHGTKIIDCRIAEISPDYTTDMKEQCRRLNIEQKRSQ